MALNPNHLEQKSMRGNRSRIWFGVHAAPGVVDRAALPAEKAGALLCVWTAPFSQELHLVGIGHWNLENYHEEQHWFEHCSSHHQGTPSGVLRSAHAQHTIKAPTSSRSYKPPLHKTMLVISRNPISKGAVSLHAILGLASNVKDVSRGWWHWLDRFSGAFSRPRYCGWQRFCLSRRLPTAFIAQPTLTGFRTVCFINTCWKLYRSQRLLMLTNSVGATT